MKYRPKIGQGDFDTKTRKIAEFLGEGHKVKVTIMFRGREVYHPELGMKILEQVAEQVAHVAKIEASPKLDGRNMTMVLAPDRKAQAGKKESQQGTSAGTSRRNSRRPSQTNRRHHRPTRRLRKRPRRSRRTRRETTMPKMKTHRGAAKRFKMTGSGKLLRLRANRQHLFEAKPSTWTRRLKGEIEVSPADAPRIKRLLGDRDASGDRPASSLVPR